MNRLFEHWKTTVAGIVFGLGQYLVVQGDHGFTWESFFVALPTFLLGVFSKDH